MPSMSSPWLCTRRAWPVSSSPAQRPSPACVPLCVRGLPYSTKPALVHPGRSAGAPPEPPLCSKHTSFMERAPQFCVRLLT